MKRSRRLLVAGAILGFAHLDACRPGSGASAPAAAVEAPEVGAQRAAEAWLSLIDRSMYEASWDSGATSLQRAITQSHWRDALIQARGPFEPFGARQLLSRTYSTTLPNAPLGEYVVLQYSTKVSGGRTVVETVVPARENGRWLVSGYYVRPQ